MGKDQSIKLLHRLNLRSVRVNGFHWITAFDVIVYCFGHITQGFAECNLIAAFLFIFKLNLIECIVVAIVPTRSTDGNRQAGT